MPSPIRLVPLLVLAALAGCATGPNAHLKADPTPFLADIPVPAGFSMTDDSQTYNAPIDQVRIARQHYDGHNDYRAVAAFFREELPPNGWLVQSQWQGGKAVILTLTKGPKVLTISISGENVFLTEIHITLDANGQDDPLAAKPVKP